MNNRGIKRGILCLIGMVILGGYSTDLFAAEEKREVVKVAFPESEGFSETDELGNRSGIVYDFLMEIAKYTDWEYEFVEGSMEELTEKVRSGAVDLMGGVVRWEDMKKDCFYSGYNMGNGYSLIFSRRDNDEIKSYDRHTMDGKTIGVYSKDTERIERLIRYLDYYNLKCDIVYYDDYEEYENCLDKKETDMMVGGDTNQKCCYYIAGKFAGEHNYFVVNKKREDLLIALDQAMENIYESNPDFAGELYRKYFEVLYSDFMNLNSKEQEYINQSKPVRIAVYGDKYPLNYMYKNNEQGVIRDIIGLIGERTGLTFEFVVGDSYQDAIDLVKNGKADIVGYFMDDIEAAREKGLVITDSYAETNEVIIKNKRVVYPGENLTIVLPEGRSVPKYIKADKVIYEKSCSACIKMVNRGEADFTCIPSVFADSALNQQNISNVTLLVQNNKRTGLTFALSKSAPKRLYAIMNKAVNSLSEGEVGRIIEKNQFSVRENYFSLSYFISAYPEVFIGIVAAFISLVAAIILIIWRTKMKQKLVLGELKQAEAANEAKSEFLSRMSHNLRAPMSTIIGLIKLVRIKEQATPEIEDYLEKLEELSNYLFSLLNNILEMSVIENDQINIQVAPFRMDRMVTQLKYMMQLQADEKGVWFECISDVRHEAYIGDALKIKQSLINLLENALKFTEAGGTVTFHIEELENREDNAVLRFGIRDNGVGIKKEDYHKIFEAFEQAEEKDVRTGTGLGLTISSRLIQLMGSEIKVDSVPGVGTEFYFTLELPVAKAEDVDEDSVLKQEMLRQEPEEGEFDGSRILLAEDNELSAEIVISLLEEKGIVVDYVENGQKAVAMFEEHPEGYYDLLLMDIYMPVMDGWTAAGKIRDSKKEDAKTVPIIAMSASTDGENRINAIRAGMNEFIPKPFEIREIYRMLRKYKKITKAKG